MGSNFTVFKTAISALSSSSSALSVASQNIANINTPGYSRQEAIFRSNSPQIIGGLELGLGVQVSRVRQIVDRFAELRLREAAGDRAESEAKAGTLERIESVFNEVNKEGLSKFLDDLFNSFQDLANDPTSNAARVTVLNKAELVVDRFHGLSQSLKDARSFIDGDIINSIEKINTLSEEIAELNVKIQAAGSGGDLVLRDERTTKVRELAELVDVSAVETSDGNFQVYIAQGMQLVDGNNSASLSTVPDAGNDNHLDIYFTVGSGSPTDITSRINGGALKGYLDVRDTNVGDYQDLLDELAYSIVTEVNTIHLTGFNLDGLTGKRFFGNLASASNAAENISLSADVDGNPDGIATSSALNKLPGDNTIMLDIAALQGDTFSFSTGDATFSGFYGNLLAKIGSNVKTEQNRAAFTSDIYDQAQGQRERISGVSMEEEQINLIRYQAAFQAASRLVTVANQILETLTALG